MDRKVPIGLTRTGEPIFANLEFLDGTRRAHASISGVSGVATKTSNATFLLHSLFHSDALGSDEPAPQHTVDWESQQVTVIDIHNLRAAAQMFVSGRHSQKGDGG
jgi:hypothetical protein